MPKKKETTEQKNEMPTPEQQQQAAAQMLQEYFTDDINNRIAEISDEQMFNTLRQLEQSEYWFAFLRYINRRLLVAQSLVNSLDPVTQPTAIGRAQGAMTGLVDMQNAIIQMVNIEKNAQRESEEIISELG